MNLKFRHICCKTNNVRILSLIFCFEFSKKKQPDVYLRITTSAKLFIGRNFATECFCQVLQTTPGYFLEIGSPQMKTVLSPRQFRIKRA